MAILISASCHIICMFTITPVLISADINKNSTQVSFLGSILKDVVMLPEKPIALNKESLMSKIEKLRDSELEAVDLTSPEIVQREIGVQHDKEKFIFPADRYIASAFKLYYKNKEKEKFKFKDILVIGPAGNRMLLYKPDLYETAFSSSNFSSHYNVTIRFRISKYGFVEKPECIISSGSSEIDQLAMRYIRRWQFVPLDKVQEGIVETRITTNQKPNYHE